MAAQFISRCQDRPLPLIMADAHEVAEQGLHLWQRSDGAPLGNSAKSPMVVAAWLALGSGFVGDLDLKDMIPQALGIFSRHL